MIDKVDAVATVDVPAEYRLEEESLEETESLSNVESEEIGVRFRHRVVIIQPWIRLGGAELLSVNLAYELRRIGHDAVIVCSFLELEGLPEWARRLKYYLPPLWLADRMRKSRVLFLILSPWLLLTLVWRHSRDSNILNPHNFPATWVAAVVGALRRIPVVWSCNEPPSRLPTGEALRVGIPDFLGWMVASSRLDRLFVRGISAICVPSAMTRFQIQERYGRVAQVLHVGVDADFFCSKNGNDPKLAFGLEGKHVLLCVGKLHPQKNQIVCLEALREVAPQIPDVVLVLAGGGPLAEELMSISREWGIERHVLFLGHVDSLTVRALYHACDINLVPAINQSWGFTAFEALCSGKISIVSRSAGGAAEILGEKRIGLVCEPTGHAFAQAILYLHQNRTMYNQLSKSGQEYAQRFLTWEAYARGTVEIFDAEFGKRL